MNITKELETCLGGTILQHDLGITSGLETYPRGTTQNIMFFTSGLETYPKCTN